MYQELDLIRSIPSRSDQLRIALEFIEEYGGWKTHLENVGHAWGADYSETRPGRELIKCTEHLNELKMFVEEIV